LQHEFYEITTQLFDNTKIYIVFYSNLQKNGHLLVFFMLTYPADGRNRFAVALPQFFPHL